MLPSLMDLYTQIKRRRRQLGLTQHDMQSRIGMSRQQYQRLEAHGNPRLDNLSLVAEGLNAELMLIPRDKVHIVQRLLEEATEISRQAPSPDVDPWHGLLDDTDDTPGHEQ
ncbi:hypothetical protein L861_02145 [Litchfieldella anticariensis FP35 = DSM 16096]|uniref:HTH cro/C1-type domain-containing protein n=1 Tax=Litchfieldella anticariensis (strain DSM 16096 / CECT 5854 / CIP 108499 / LMG 22089 / FP35) TaxID=1121939 RepID=S2L8G3_LITA3|nr:helix-turn-helix transcriptional regulator [Halomonas anticariensis]EPC04134.1 hypothetical protein L861_02145 [Halomonas anticariensis FP35 = DSM 16096]